MKYTYEQLAKMIDHSLLHPTMTDHELEEGCQVAAKYGVASVCIKPYAVQRAVELLRGSGVLVVGHGGVQQRVVDHLGELFVGVFHNRLA